MTTIAGLAPLILKGEPGEKGEPGATGPVGLTPALEIGEVSTVPHGHPARAWLTGTPERPVLNLSLPCGAPGRCNHQGS